MTCPAASPMLEALIALARQGRILVFFPEGTFTRRAGLSGFYLGAFKVAAEANLPVLPGVIRGTRSMLRGDQWFPRQRGDQRRDRGAGHAVGHGFQRRCCSCAMRCATSCWLVAGSPISGS